MRTFKDGDGMEYLVSYNLGYAVKPRVLEALNKGLLVRSDKIKDYVFTWHAVDYKNFWLWLQGDHDTLVLKKSV